MEKVASRFESPSNNGGKKEKKDTDATSLETTQKARKKILI